MNGAMIALLALVIWLVLSRALAISLRQVARRKEVNTYRLKTLSRFMQILLFLSVVILALMAVGVNSHQLFLAASSLSAVLGVALFAQWSILSNITASMVIFFSYPYRVGDRIEVVEKDLDLVGVIEEITLFNVLIRHDRGDLIVYPNNMLIQKAVRKAAPARREDAGLPPPV